jgi:hypothetical protein
VFRVVLGREAPAGAGRAGGRRAALVPASSRSVAKKPGVPGPERAAAPATPNTSRRWERVMPESSRSWVSRSLHSGAAADAVTGLRVCARRARRERTVGPGERMDGESHYRYPDELIPRKTADPSGPAMVRRWGLGGKRGGACPVDHGPRTTDHGQRTADSGQRTAEWSCLHQEAQEALSKGCSGAPQESSNSISAATLTRSVSLPRLRRSHTEKDRQ